MEDIPFINSTNMDNYLYLVPDIVSLGIKTLLRGESTYDFLGNNYFCFILQGSARLELTNYDHQICTRILNEDDLAYIAPSIPYTITALSESVKFLYINLHLRMPTKLPSPANPACLGIADGNSDIHYVLINLFLPPHIPVCPHNNAYILLNLIRYEVEHRPIGYSVYLHGLLSSLVVELLRATSQEQQHVLEHMDMVCVTSHASRGHLFPKGGDLRISDVEIWSAPPRSASARLLASFSAQSPYIDIPRPDDPYAASLQAIGDQEPFSHMHITAQEQTPYQVWFNKMSGNTIDLYPYRTNAQITCRVRSNLPGVYGLGLYNTYDYSSIFHSLYIDRPNEWISITIPLINFVEETSYSTPVTYILHFIRNHYAENFHLQEIAQQLHISPAYMAQLFKAETGCSVKRHLKEVRINAAKRLLSCTKDPISKIAVQTGFYDSAHFCRTFRAVTDMTPQEFRNNLK